MKEKILQRLCEAFDAELSQEDCVFFDGTNCAISMTQFDGASVITVSDFLDTSITTEAISTEGFWSEDKVFIPEFTLNADGIVTFEEVAC